MPNDPSPKSFVNRNVRHDKIWVSDVLPGVRICGSVSKVFLGVGYNHSAEFFSFLRSKGIYLDDLCLEPINKKGSKEGEVKREEYIEYLANRLVKYKPDIVIIVFKGIKKHIIEAIKKSNIDTDLVGVVAFPAYDQRERFKEEMGEGLRQLRKRSLI